MCCMTIEECRRRKRDYKRLLKKARMCREEGNALVYKVSDIKLIETALFRSLAIEDINIGKLKEKVKG